MFDFIPIESYTTIYHQLMLLVLVVILLHSLVLDIDDKKNIRFIQFFGFLTFLKSEFLTTLSLFSKALSSDCFFVFNFNFHFI